MPNREYIERMKIKFTSNFCIYCWTFLEEWEKEIDHFEPYEWYYSNRKENLYISCRECNSIKSNKWFLNLQEARDYILPIKLEKWVSLKKEKSKCKKKKNKIKKQKYNYIPKNIIYNKECFVCWKKYETKKWNQKYCSIECSKSIYTHICKQCWIEYKNEHKNSLFCNRKCHNTYKMYK